MSRLVSLIGLVLMLLLGVSCDHKELCYDHDQHTERVEYKLELDFECEWEYNIDSNA